MKPGDLVAERFEVRELSGSGGMGEVYRARDRMNGISVALKVLRVQAPGSEDSVERFFREARVLSELRHPGIVGYVAHGETIGGEVYIAMEWLDGEDLSDRLARGPLGIEDSIELGRRVAGAIGAAHARGIVHRDLKPDNVFLVQGRIDNAKILDFGLARLAEGTQKLTRTGIAVGTPAYMAPEQAVADAHVDARADVFSLGCMLFECLTGRPPFGGERLRAVLLKILHEEPPRLRDLRPSVPAALDDLVARMLAKTAAARPSDGNAVAAELEGLSSGAISTVPSSIPTAAAITRAERRLTAFIVVSSRNNGADDPALAQTAQADLGISEIRRAVDSHGGGLDIIADGSIVVTLTTSGAATDLAAQAARCAVAIRASVPNVAIAIAMGRREILPSADVSHAAERAVSLIAEIENEPPPELDSLAPIRIDEVTAGLLDARFELLRDERSTILVKERDFIGKPRTVLGKTTPFVGRERELAGLRAIFDECESEPVARVVLVTAPAGYGKSRLCFELLRVIAELQGPVEIWRGRGSPTMSGAPLAMLGTVVRSVAFASEGESLESQRKKLESRVARHLVPSETARVTEFLGELSGISFPSDRSAALRAARAEPLLMNEQMRRAWEDFLVAECGAGPVVIVLEDLQWGDLPTVRFIDNALRRLKHRPLFVLATARPQVSDAFPRLWAERGLTEMRLGALSKRACERIVRAVLGDEPCETDVASLVTRADGNPFFLEEFIRAYAAGQGPELPDTLVAMVQTRIERLDADARRVLRAASVFGNVFDPAGVRALLGAKATNDDVVRWLAELSNQEFVEPASDGITSAPGYAFRQLLVREAAYAMLTEEDRKLAHRLAGNWLASSHGDAVVVARHFERADELDRAADAYIEAAEVALRASDPSSAVSHAERARSLGVSAESLGALKGVEAAAHLAKGDLELAEQAGLDASHLLARGSERWFRTCGALASAAFLSGHWSRFDAICDELSDATPIFDAREACITAISTVALLSTRSGRLDRAKVCIDRANLQSVTGAPLELFSRGRLALARASYAWYADAEPWSQLRFARRAAGTFALVNDLADLGEARLHAGSALIAMGAHREAEQSLRETLMALEASDMRIGAAALRPWLGLTLARQGHFESARKAAEHALEKGRQVSNEYLESTARVLLAEIELLAENPRAAEREALAVVRKGDPRFPIEVHARAVLATALLRLDRDYEALENAELAIQSISARGGIGHGEALLWLTHAEALARLGERGRAEHALGWARKRLETRAAAIEDTARKGAFLTQVPEHAKTLALAKSWAA